VKGQTMNPLIAITLLLSLAPTVAIAQSQNHTYRPETRPEVAVEYSYEHANAPPADCGCFSLNGGSISVAKPFGSGHFAFAFDATVANGTSAPQYGVTLSTFTAGARYRPMPEAKWNLFGQILVGAAHATGSLVGGNTPAANDPALVFASTIGGGLDRRLGNQWSLRLVEADYVLTTFSNGANNVQNTLRISTGIAYQFGKR
jgi:outer membrane immunogenic protein